MAADRSGIVTAEGVFSRNLGNWLLTWCLIVITISRAMFYLVTSYCVLRQELVVAVVKNVASEKT